MKIKLCIGILVVVSNTLAAQSYKFGKIPDHQLAMELYEKDSTASAVVLFDVGNAEIDYKQSNLKLEVSRHTRIKIFNDDALDLADIAVDFRHEDPEQKILNVKGVSYCKDSNGEMITSKLGRKEKFIEKVTSSWSKYKFSIPNVQAGCIIEYEYKMITEYIFDFPNWFFQREIPTVWSEFNTKIPEFYKFLSVTRGYHEYSIKEETPYNEPITILSNSGRDSDVYVLTGVKNKYIMADLPAIKNEPFMRAKVDYLAHLRFELAAIDMPNSLLETVIPTWSELVDYFDEYRNYGDRLKGSKTLKNVANSITKDIKSNLDKMIAIYDHVQKTIEWDERHRLYTRKSLEEVYKEGNGHSSAINFVLIQLLREAGFEAYPVLVSTTGNGEIIGLFPEATQFNSTITYVAIDGQYYLLDPKNRSRPYNILPFNVLGSNGLMVYTDQLVWLPVDQIVKNSSFKNITVTIDQDSIRANINTQLKGLYAVDMDELHKKEDFSDALTKKYFGTNPVYNISDLTIHSNEVLEGYDIDFKITRKGTSDYSIFYFNPMIMDRLGSNPFKLENRTYPIDYDYPFDESIVMTINIPEGWTIDELPQPVLYRLPGRSGEFRRIIRADGNQISMNYRLKIDKIRFMPEEYEVLKGMYDQMVSSLAERIVLKKTP